MTDSGIEFLDVYAGMGGACSGLMAMGFHPKVSIEKSAKACRTLSRVVGHDVAPMDDTVLLTDFDKGSLPEIWWTSPPCQPFAPSGLKEGENSEMNRWPVLIKAVAKHRPTWLMTENVAGMLHKPHLEYKIHLISQLRCLFKHVVLFLLDAADYGVPQHRKRVFIVCGPHRVLPPLPSHSRATLEHDKATGAYYAQGAHGLAFSSDPRARGRDGCRAHVTVREALHIDLEGIVLGGGTNPRGRDREYERTFREITGTPSTTISAQYGGGAGNAGPFVIEGRFGHGRSTSKRSLDLPSLTITTAGDLRLAKDSSKPAWFHRSGPVDEPSRAISSRGNASIDIGEHRRRLTWQECAALQSFEPDHPFDTALTRTDLFTGVGNAVPPPLAGVVSSTIQPHIKSSWPKNLFLWSKP